MRVMTCSSCVIGNIRPCINPGSADEGRHPMVGNGVAPVSYLLSFTRSNRECHDAAR